MEFHHDMHAEVVYNLVTFHLTMIFLYVANVLKYFIIL